MIGVDENDNKTEPEDATHDKVDDFNEDICDLCVYDFLTFENYQHTSTPKTRSSSIYGKTSRLKTINANKPESEDATHDTV